MSEQKTLLVMAGGTGGHIFPALAVAEALRERGWRIVWLGNPEGMEARLVPQHGIEMVWVRFAALRGKGWLRKLLLPVNLLRAFIQAGQALRQVRPHAVLGMGGYITFPGGVMARLLGYPLVVHEQNAVAGMANKVLSRIANLTLSGFPDVLPGTRWVGNPVRAEIKAVPSPAERFAQRHPLEKLRLLVVGGSLGAAALNEVVPQGLALLPPDARPLVTHQAGEKQIEALRAHYAAAGVEADCVPFIADMASAYAQADWVICRAGALTVAELAAVGAASVLVPFPFAVDDHQTVNAGFLSEAGAAIRVPQHELTPARVAALAQMTRGQWLSLAVQARVQGRPEATAEVADALEQVALGSQA